MKKECSSYILKCEHNGKSFICNRNAFWVDRMVKVPEYIKWWEIPTEELFFWCIKGSHITILEEIPNCSNEGLKDQKKLNFIKRMYQTMYPEANEKICDMVIAEAYRGLKKRMKEKMNELLRLRRVAIKYGNEYKFLKELMDKHPDLLYKPRYQFPSFEKSGIQSKYKYAFFVCEKNEARSRKEEEERDREMERIYQINQ